MLETRTGEAPARRYSLPGALIHEVRTSLNQIIGYSEMLLDQAAQSGNEAFAPDLMKVHTAGVQLLGLVEERLDPNAESEEPAPRVVEQLNGSLGDHADDSGLDESTGDTAAVGKKPPLLLVVDDIEANRDVLSRRLRRQGYEVATADNGQHALDMLAEQAFDLVLLDIMMPEIDGYEVLRRLKLDEQLKHIPVLMISALNDFTAVGRCIEMGAEDYLPKPFNPILLRARIGASLEKKAAHDREVHLFEELQQNFRRLKEVEKLRDDLTHMIIHDLRTPLSSVIAGMQALGAVGDLTDIQTEMADIAIFGGRTLLGLINDVLDVERSESGSLELRCVELSADELFAGSIAQVAALATSKGLTVEQQIVPELPPLHGDEHLLIRTIVNLLGNAIKFTPPGGIITVHADLSAEKQSMVFSVHDSGEGIPSEAFERIFDKFGQVESRQNGRTMSTGLGLTFCKLAVESHGGHIGVRSTPGSGSTFWFTIPLPAD